MEQSILAALMDFKCEQTIEVHSIEESSHSPPGVDKRTTPGGEE